VCYTPTHEATASIVRRNAVILVRDLRPHRHLHRRNLAPSCAPNSPSQQRAYAAKRSACEHPPHRRAGRAENGRRPLERQPRNKTGAADCGGRPSALMPWGPPPPSCGRWSQTWRCQHPSPPPPRRPAGRLQATGSSIVRRAASGGGCAQRRTAEPCAAVA